MRVMVTGGRHFGMMQANKNPLIVWSERNWLIDALNRLHTESGPITCLLHGECPDGGADLIADIWARSHGIPADPTPVNHTLDGPWPGAGPRRNARMIAKRPAVVVAAPGRAGTANAVKQAKAAYIDVIVIP